MVTIVTRLHPPDLESLVSLANVLSTSVRPLNNFKKEFGYRGDGRDTGSERKEENIEPR